MKKRILSYMTMIDTQLYKDRTDRKMDYEKMCQRHLTQLHFFMHERSVHLAVMILFALLAFGDFFAMVVSFQNGLVILFLALLVLLIPYIMHYYLLENSCQYMYRQYDEMQRRLYEGSKTEVFFEEEHLYRYLPEEEREPE
ncbi:MAG: hypothetical protein K5739_10070 [Lachnospiraceae bacterium]|nr:hypothetical protein [Lachnospiraceae bacterium]